MATGTPTTNLGLITWNGTDYVLRTDFNTNWETIDAFAGNAATLNGTSPFTAIQTATAWAVSGLTGAANASRYAGATASGAPASGTFAVGDFVIDYGTPAIWICTSSGSPGTWVKTGISYTAGNGISISGATISNTGILSITNGTGITVSVTGGAATIENGGVTNFNTRTGAVTLTSSDVTGALTYTPLSTTGTAADSSKLGGQLPGYYLAATAQAADSAKLGGQLPGYYATAAELNGTGPAQINWTSAVQTVPTGSGTATLTFTLTGLNATANSYSFGITMNDGTNSANDSRALVVGYGSSYQLAVISATYYNVSSVSLSSGTLTVVISATESNVGGHTVSVSVEGMIL